MKCKKCKKVCEVAHQCEECGVAMCLPCDETSDYLSWFETSIDTPDRYLCKKCIKKQTQVLTMTPDQTKP